MVIEETIKSLATIDIFDEAKSQENFAGRPFHIDYDYADILVSDAWKMNVGGLPQGSFLLAFYENEENVKEALLLRVLKPIKLPTDNDVISSMVEYYKDNLKTAGIESELDDFTRYEFSFSGLECRILGTFYKDQEGNLCYGADVENFYSANNYSVYKIRGKVLEKIVNFRDGQHIPGSHLDQKIGDIRYSSTIRFQKNDVDVPVYVNPKDFLGKRTALFGMTRTGKSNTVKKIVEATAETNKLIVSNDLNDKQENAPTYPVGQIIFDINGEYANPNIQDGTAIFELYKNNVVRYCTNVRPEEDFKVLKVNFYNEIQSGFELIKSHLTDNSDYVNSFKSIDLTEPDDSDDYSETIRYNRKKAAYLCCLYQAGLKPPSDFKVQFKGRDEINKMVNEDEEIKPDSGISLDKATDWFTAVWNNYNKHSFFEDYQNKKGHEWADEDLKALLVFLTRCYKPGGKSNISGYRKLSKMRDLHTPLNDNPFEDDIIDALNQGKIVLIDLSQGDPEVQKLYSEKICRSIFNHSMDNFTKNKTNNFVQLYFEEAHNLFPKKEDKDLSDIYARIAKEGAKLYLGLIYATQEPSSISSNVLKNTQNWFIAHLNNEDELKEIRKYYDFNDFADRLISFNSFSDKGFVRMKTYSNSFTVPVHIEKF